MAGETAENVLVTRDYFERIRDGAKDNAPLIVGGVAGLGMYLLLGDSVVSEKPGKGIETFNKNKYLVVLLLALFGWWLWKKKGKTVLGLAAIALAAVFAAKVYYDEEQKKKVAGGTTGDPDDYVRTPDGDWFTHPETGVQYMVPRGFRGGALGQGSGYGGDSATRIADNVYGAPG